MVASTTPSSGFSTTITWAGHDMGYMRDISGPSIKADVIDVSSRDSADRAKDFLKGMVDGGEVSIEVLAIPGNTTGQKYFLDDLQADSDTSRQVIITFPDAISKWTFNAIPTGYDASFPYADSLVATLTMKVTGKPVFTNS